jgi:serine/threonine protein kinase
LDPTYYTTWYLTDKSDVYSFGVILIELLTREKPVSYRSPEGDGLVKHFSTLVSERKLACILDPQVVKEGADISLLTAMCVKFVSKKRPTVRQVEMILGNIHAAKEYDSSHMTHESEEDY